MLQKCKKIKLQGVTNSVKWLLQHYFLLISCYYSVGWLWTGLDQRSPVDYKTAETQQWYCGVKRHAVFRPGVVN